MPCYHPLQAFASKAKNTNGKSTIVFKKQIGSSSTPMEPIKVPCGRCIGCRLERSRQWALRCMHESSLYSRNCFITLTYNPENLPPDGGLQLKHFQLFLKRLRKKFGNGIRFFHCGEYGETCKQCGLSKPFCWKKFRHLHKFDPQIGRPHYHACLFNFDFNDRIPYKTTNGHTIYSSKTLSDLWTNPDTGSALGFCSVGDVTFESAAYVARYITKKINGTKSKDHYQGKKPEYITMSRGGNKKEKNPGGIGKGWYEKYSSECYPSDYLIHREMKMKPPKFYDKLLEKSNELVFTQIKQTRKQQMKFDPLEESPQRRKVKETLKKINFKTLIRSYEHED